MNSVIGPSKSTTLLLEAIVGRQPDIYVDTAYVDTAEAFMAAYDSGRAAAANHFTSLKQLAPRPSVNPVDNEALTEVLRTALDRVSDEAFVYHPGFVLGAVAGVLDNVHENRIAEKESVPS